MYKKLIGHGNTQGTAIDVIEDDPVGSTKVPKRPWKGTMGGSSLEILLASASLIMPMMALTVALIALVFRHQMPDNNSSYSSDTETALALGSAFYVDYSSTTLVYIASLSSTLATLLISAAMLLFSFSLAQDIATNSDRAAAWHLPSPYQMDMLIRMIDGRLMVLGSYLLYVCGLKKRRARIVPVIWHAFSVLAAFVLLAILISLADLWLHLGTKSVQYLELRSEPSSALFTPGRDFTPDCLGLPDRNQQAETPDAEFCMVLSQDAGNPPQLVNQTEFLKTSGNSSSLHQIYLSDGRAVLGPAEPPVHLDFQATSFGSKTSCQSVTIPCGAVSFDDQKSSAVGQFNFVCNSSIAGLNMTGNFQNVLAPIDERTGNTTGPKVDDGTEGDDHVYPNLVVLGGNTIAANSFDLGFQFFNDAQKQQQLPKPDIYFGYGFDMIENNVQINNQMHWALVWRAPFISPLDEDKGSGSAAVEMNGQRKSGSFGILSCDTEISEVVSQLESTYYESLFTSFQSYDFSQGSMKVTSSRIPRPKALIPFIVSATAQWSYDRLHLGLQQSFAAAKYSTDFVTSFATYYDQVLLSVPSGVMVDLPASSASRRVETLVTRVPKAPFLAVVLLNLLYAAVGIILTVTAVLANIRGQGIRDAQVRLSLAAVVAESFESPAFRDDATRIDELYAERRGLATRKVAISKRADGGRRYRLLVEKEAGEDQKGEEMKSLDSKSCHEDGLGR